MPKKTKTDQRTLVTFLLDRTGSMGLIKKPTIEAFNGYLDGLKGEGHELIDFTLVQFDYHGGPQLEKVHFEKAIKDVPDLDDTTYQPRGGTPLIEASIITITKLAEAIGKKTEKPKVVVCIQTDGEENQSGPEFTWAALSALIKEKTKEGWQFNFMGAGIDAYDQGAKMGIARASTVAYNHMNPQQTRASFAATASNTRSFASGASANTAYSVKQKLDSGDAWDQTLKRASQGGGAFSLVDEDEEPTTKTRAEDFSL